MAEIVLAFAVEQLLQIRRDLGDSGHTARDETLMEMGVEKDKPIGVIDVVGVGKMGLPVDPGRGAFWNLLVVDAEIAP